MTDALVRGLRALCGDTSTADAVCAPWDPTVTGTYRTPDQSGGHVPAGVVPESVRQRVTLDSARLARTVTGQAT